MEIIVYKVGIGDRDHSKCACFSLDCSFCPKRRSIIYKKLAHNYMPGYALQIYSFAQNPAPRQTLTNMNKILCTVVGTH